MSTNTEPGDRITVESFNDIEETTSRITDRQRQLIKEILNNEVGDEQAVVWLPEWMDKPDLNAVSGTEKLFVVSVEDYSEDAYAAAQDGLDDSVFLPKDWVVVFEPSGNGTIESSQTGLFAFEN